MFRFACTGELGRMAGKSPRRVTEAVSYDMACERVLALLDMGPARKSIIGKAIWPNTDWRMPQGAAFAAAKIVRQMCDEGLIRLCAKPAHHYTRSNAIVSGLPRKGESE